MTAVPRLEGNLVGGMIGDFEPRLQERGQILIHVFLEGLARSTYLEHTERSEVRGGGHTQCIMLTGVSTQTIDLYRTLCVNCVRVRCGRLTGSILRMTRDFFFLVAWRSDRM